MPSLTGHVVSGLGNFSFWIDKLSDYYLRKTGMRLFPGTLNLRLDQPWSLPAHPLRLEACEYGGTVSVNLVPCTVHGRPAFILRTDANERGQGHHPKTILEIACDVKLRDCFHLSDGDPLTVEIPHDVIVYSRTGCHLCDVVKAALARLQPSADFRWREVDIDADPTLRREYNDQVPVVFIDGRKAFKYHMDEDQFLRALADRA